VWLLNYATLVDPLLADLRTCVTEFASIQANDKVLDICCGTGDQVFYYVRKGADATGVDENPSMIKTAEKSKRNQGLRHAAFRLASATALPFPDHYFDCVSISLGLHEMKRENRDKTMSEMKRVVKRGGILLFTDFKVPLPRNRIGYFIRAVECIAGRENYRCFRDYLDQGGLHQLLLENQLKPYAEDYLKSDTIQIVKSASL
jgi:ubiquinone/menaquinone biosynthesis C-methylase UbiE